MSQKRWFISRWAAILGALALSLALWARFRDVGPASAPAGAAHDPVHATLLRRVCDLRPVEPRLSGFFGHFPCRRDVSSSQLSRCSDLPDPWSGRFQALARTGREIRDRARRQPTARHLHTLGVWHLLWSTGTPTSGDTAGRARAGRPLAIGRAIEALEEAKALAPDDSGILADLAAAYLVAADMHGDAFELVRALATADRAVAAAPESEAALFNRALSLSRLTLAEDATEAWNTFLAAAPSGSPWAQEARERLAELAATTTEDWADALEGLDDPTRPGTADELRALVARFPQEATKWTEEELFADWASAVEAGDTARAAALLTAVDTVGEELERATGDPMLGDAAAALATVPPGDRAALARAHALWAEAKALYDRRDAVAAAERFTRAEADLRDAGSPFASWCRYYRAVERYWAGDLSAAVGSLGELGETLEPAGYLRALAHVDRMTGLIAIEDGRFSDAVAAYRSAVHRFETAGLRGAAAFTRTLVADALLRLGEPRGAFALFHPALAELSQAGDGPRAAALSRCAEGLTAGGYPEVALYFHSRAITAALASGVASVVSEALYTRAGTYHDLGRETAARDDLTEARRWLAAIDDPEIHRMVEAQIAHTDARVGRQRSYAEPSEATRELDRLTEALRYFTEVEAELFLPELLLERARLHLDRKDLAAAEEDLVRSVDIAQRQRETIGEASWRVSFAAVVRAAVEELLLLRLDQDRPRDEILPWTDLLRDAGSFVGAGELRRVRAVWNELADVPLPESTALISLSVLEDSTLCWSLRAGQVRLSRAAISRRELAALVAEASRLDVPLSATEDARATLYEILLAPFAEELAGVETLYVTPDRELYRAPFPALYDRSRGEHLVERHALVTTPSAALLLASVARQQGRRTVRPESVLAVGDPKLDARRHLDLPPLPMARQEALAVAALYPRAEILLGEDVTKERLVARLGATRIFHFAGHALANPEHPEASRLVLAGDTAEQPVGLFASEVREMDLEGTDLVVLAACGTARTRSDDPSGVLSLAAPFLTAGAQAVVASLADVEDSLGSEVFTDFHARVAAGESVPEALRLAQLAQLAARRGTAGDWASFRVITYHRLDSN